MGGELGSFILPVGVHVSANGWLAGDELGTRPGCHPAFTLQQMGEPPAAPVTLSSGKSGFLKCMVGSQMQFF